MPAPNQRSSQIIEQLSHQGIGALPALTELTQLLSMGTEDSLAGFNYRTAVPLLITHLGDDEVEGRVIVIKTFMKNISNVYVLQILNLKKYPNMRPEL